MDIQSGDILLIWNMPYPLASQVIYQVSGGHLDHCAICLGQHVYEATIPVCRRMRTEQYLSQLLEWSLGRHGWRQRKEKRLTVEAWRFYPTPPVLTAMTAEADRWLGTRYSMIWNYIYDRPSIHCSEFVGRCIEAGGLYQWQMPYSKIEPMGVRHVCRASGATSQTRIYAL